MKHIYTSIDIGSDTIKIVVCELFQNKLNLLSASSFKSKGIKKGLITDIDEASISVRQAFNEVEQTLGIKINKVIASVPSYLADYSFVKNEIDLDHAEADGITREDINNVLNVNIDLGPSKEIVTVLPIDFRVDDEEFIKDPTGMTGKKLGSRSIVITTPKKNIVSVVSLLENIGIDVLDISLNNIGDLYAFKTRDMEKRLGVIVNIGSETTSVSLYNKNVIIKSSLINMGGKNIDNDISYMYKVDGKTANELKHKFALGHKRNANVADTYEVETTVGDIIKINQFEISEVVSSRIEEILTLAKKEINNLTSKKIDYIIVTGGTSNMVDIEYVASDIFGKDVSLGNIKLLGLRNNKYSACIGNVVYYISKIKLKGQNMTMVDENNQIKLATAKRNSNDVSNATMLGRLYDYFFKED